MTNSKDVKQTVRETVSDEIRRTNTILLRRLSDKSNKSSGNVSTIEDLNKVYAISDVGMGSAVGGL